jgi:Rieske 2Fe-2S family protein
VCPYHAWTYALDGQLVGTRYQLKCDDFDKKDYTLFNVGVEEWGGCIFVNLRPEESPPLREILEEELFISDMKNWPLQALRAAYHSTMILECNWKVFQENFAECFHCPGVHPEFCDIVPLYGKGLVEGDEEALKNHKSNPGNLPDSGFRSGAVTWSMDGQSNIPPFPNLSEAEKATGFHYFSIKPGFLLEALQDCVILIRILPLAPEKTEVTMEILYDQSAPGKHDGDIKKINDFLELVMNQDCRICEVNQKGMHSNRFEHGVLVPQEYEVHNFQQWVLRELGEC